MSCRQKIAMGSDPMVAKGEIIVYQPDETMRLDVRIEKETIWLTQNQMAQLFGCSVDEESGIGQ